ncbi:MAG: hydrogenase maturation nickel metallochaperone HypA [Chthoniobacterales bacterium]|nr:hydrogenase maturation nickel metallochaperone HypA [Chthoniobacterales bacterium]
MVAAELIKQLRKIASDFGFRNILRAKVRLGLMSGVVPEALNLAFESFTKNEQVLKNCSLEIEVIAMELTCPACGESFNAQALHERCPRCSSWAYATLGSSEITLASIEAES